MFLNKIKPFHFPTRTIRGYIGFNLPKTYIVPMLASKAIYDYNNFLLEVFKVADKCISFKS